MNMRVKYISNFLKDTVILVSEIEVEYNSNQNKPVHTFLVSHLYHVQDYLKCKQNLACDGRRSHFQVRGQWKWIRTIAVEFTVLFGYV